jgi:hypothetical protein
VPQNVYCDEAGFSGNNLLDANQPFFTYSAVALDEADAANTVKEAIARFRLKGNELKGKNLVGHSLGQRAITWVLETHAQSALVSAWHKRYCLATKFFEYVFEPVLAEKNSIFYGIGFHRFISNVLFFEAFTNNQSARDTLVAFQQIARARDGKGVERLFPDHVVHSADYSSVLSDITEFVSIHRSAIQQEMASFAADEPLYRWLLDLSVSALFALLTSWGQRYDSLRVFCDDSKPLSEGREPFDMMIGRTDKAHVVFEGKEQSLIFNLAEPLNFASSSATPGIQIADVFSSALAYIVREPTNDLAKSWLKLLEPSLSEFSVFPDSERIDLSSKKGFINRVVLHELVIRSKARRNLFRGMPQFIGRAYSYWYLHTSGDAPTP